MNTTLHRQSRTPSTAVLAAISAGSIALSALTAHAGTVTVCLGGSCDFTDPVAAVNAALEGDVVEIAAGTYALTETVALYGKSITIRGAVDANGNPATVLDGQNARTVLSAVSMIAQPLFENLVITKGRANTGGGMFLSGVSPVLKNCHFRANVANYNGGAVYLSSSNPTMIDCEITGNQSGSGPFPNSGTAGAVSVTNNALTLIGCTVSGNSASLYGGAFLLTSSGIVNLGATRVCGNTAPTNPQVHLNGGYGTVNTDASSCVSNTCNDCPQLTPCPADFTLDRVVNGADLALMLGSWGSCGTYCPHDLNFDGVVNGADLGLMLSAWGACVN